jgi:hypothetical protein
MVTVAPLALDDAVMHFPVFCEIHDSLLRNFQSLHTIVKARLNEYRGELSEVRDVNGEKKKM